MTNFLHYLFHMVERGKRERQVGEGEKEKTHAQHERVTKNVEFMEDGIGALLKNGAQPIISHYITKTVAPN